jgi:hypothetical protein
LRTTPDEPPDEATLVRILKSDPRVSYRVIESRSFSFDAGIRGAEADRSYRNASSSPTATETRRVPIAWSISSIHGALETSKARTGDVPVALRASCATQRARSRTTPLDAKQADASACDAGSSVSGSISLQPCRVLRCSSTIWPGRSGRTDIETSTHEPAPVGPATSAASTIARTRTSTWLVVEARHDASA